jgi:parallel beta-helix repeat protein
MVGKTDYQAASHGLTSDPPVPTVDGTDVVTSRAVGLALIAAMVGIGGDTARVSQLGASSWAAPEKATVALGGSTRLHASAVDAKGVPGRGVSFTWSSSAPAFATLSDGGEVHGIGEGMGPATGAGGEMVAGVPIPVTREASATPPSPSSDFAAVIRGIRPRGYGQGAYSLLKPGAGATTYYVSPTGNDANPGTSAAPFRTINHAAQVAVAGDVVTIGAGEYRETVAVKNSGTEHNRIVFQAEERGRVVLTGGQHIFGPAHWTGSMTSAGQFFVTVRGLVFREYALPQQEAVNGLQHPALRAARGWVVEDCWFDRSGAFGLDIRGSFVEVLRTTFNDHWINALTAVGISNQATRPTDPGFRPLEGLRIVDVVLRGNHVRTSQPGSPTANFVAKFLNTRGTVVDNMESFENNGTGFWFDARNIDYVVRNSYFHDNRSQTGSTTDGGGRGLYIEINWPEGLIENNVFANNLGPALDLANSSGITVRNNLFNGNDLAIRFVEWERGFHPDGAHVFPLRDIRVTHNQIRDWSQSNGAIQAGIAKPGFKLPSTHDIVLNANVYQGVRRTGPLGMWWNTLEGVRIGHMQTIADMQSMAGWEIDGRTGTMSVP